MNLSMIYSHIYLIVKLFWCGYILKSDNIINHDILNYVLISAKIWKFNYIGRPIYAIAFQYYIFIKQVDDSFQMLFIFCLLYKCLRGNLIMKEIIDTIDFICAIWEFAISKIECCPRHCRAYIAFIHIYLK
jgi:hypothetical protein